MKIVLFWKKISSLFKYSERTVASTVTNDISAESSWSQLLGARQTRAWHDQEGVTPTFRKGHWKKKQIWRSKFRMQKKKFLMQFLIFFCYELIVCPLIFKSIKVYFASSLIAKPIVYLGYFWEWWNFWNDQFSGMMNFGNDEFPEWWIFGNDEFSGMKNLQEWRIFREWLIFKNDEI